MGFPDTIFSPFWMLAGNALFAGIVLAALRAAPRSRLRQDGQLSVWLGTIVVLVLVWSMRAGVMPGQVLHLLGATLVTLMFGPCLGVLALTIVAAAVNLNVLWQGGELAHWAQHWQAFGLNGLVTVAFPVMVAELVRRSAERWLPANFFVYVFVVVFFGAGLTAVSTGTLSSILMWLGGVYPVAKLVDEYLLYFILLGFSEAWLNGAVITLMIVYFPGWVSSFDDERYLLNK